jgi:predicted permease
VTQIALAVVLVAGAGLLGKSLMALSAVDLGIDVERLVVLRTTVPVANFNDAPRATAFYRDVLPEIRALPGIVAAGAVTGLPTAVRSNGGYWIQGGPGPEEQGIRSPQAIFTVNTPDYFRTMKVPIVRGRDFNDGDRRGAPMVAIVNESLARDAFQGRDPIGLTIRTGLDTLDPMTIVGVVRDVRTWGPTRPAQAEVYMPYEQHPGPATALNIVARAQTDNPTALAATISKLIRDRDPDVPVRVNTMEDTLATANATPRFRTLLLITFATVALVLAIAGVYGVMAFTVSRRVPEIGVRVALGATPSQVMALVLREGAMLTTTGLILGLTLVLAGARVLQGLLFGVTPSDPGVLVAVAVLVALAALTACAIPGRRALRVDPTTALRAE